MRFIGTLSISILILLWALSCVEEEDVYTRTISNPVFQREPPTKRDTSVEKDYYDFLNQKLKYFKERRKSDLFVFDFGSNQSPYIEGSIIVTPFNKTIYHRWVNNFGILDFDQNLINPLLTDFLMGVNGNEIVLNIPEGEYELTLVSGSHNSDIRAFLIEVDNVEYRVYNKNFGNFASRKGYYSFNTIDKGIVVKKDGLRIKFKDDWIVNAIIMRLLGNFEIKRYSKLPRYNYRADFYNLLTRDNAIKWSRKFGYNYGLNWDYVVEMSENILRSAGLTNVDNFTKIKYIADYVDKMTRETCCEIPEIDILNSPVDILDPNGFRKGSCFGLARLVGVLANYYGLPARLVGYFIDSDFAEYPSLFPQISSPLFVVKGSYPYYTFSIGGYNHTEVEVYYEGKWRLITNYRFEDHLASYSAMEVVNNRDIFSIKRNFYNNVADVLFLNLYIANVNRSPDYCELPYSYAFYDLDTATSIYPENSEWMFKSDNHVTARNSLRIGRFWSIRGILELRYDWVKRIGRDLFVPKLRDNEEIILNIMVSSSNRNIEENLNLYVNGIKIDYESLDRIRNFSFQSRKGGVFQFRVRIDKDRILEERLNSFDVELKDANSSVSFVVGTNDNRILGYDTFTMDYCNQWEMMRSSNSYYYEGSKRHYLYNNPLIFLEIVENK